MRTAGPDYTRRLRICRWYVRHRQEDRVASISAARGTCGRLHRDEGEEQTQREGGSPSESTAPPTLVDGRGPVPGLARQPNDGRVVRQGRHNGEGHGRQRRRIGCCLCRARPGHRDDLGRWRLGPQPLPGDLARGYGHAREGQQRLAPGRSLEDRTHRRGGATRWDRPATVDRDGDHPGPGWVQSRDPARRDKSRQSSRHGAGQHQRACPPGDWHRWRKRKQDGRPHRDSKHVSPPVAPTCSGARWPQSTTSCACRQHSGSPVDAARGWSSDAARRPRTRHRRSRHRPTRRKGGRPVDPRGGSTGERDAGERPSTATPGHSRPLRPLKQLGLRSRSRLGHRCMPDAASSSVR
jgi:hypothetical protein